MRKTIIGIFLVCMIAISVAGITGGIGTIGVTEPIVKDKEIPDAEYQELKSVLKEWGNVEIDDKVGLDINWTEVECKENKDENNTTTGTTCQYKLYKEGLFGGNNEIFVKYPVDSTKETKQVLLDKEIQDKVEFVKGVWANRLAEKKAKELAELENGEPQTGTTKFISDKTTEEPIK